MATFAIKVTPGATAARLRLLFVLLAVCVGVALAAHHAALARGEGGSSFGAARVTTYADAGGDAKAGPDLTRVTVTNGANGIVRFDLAAELTANSPQGYVVFLHTNAKGLISDEACKALLVVAQPRHTVVVAIAARSGRRLSVPSLKAAATESDLTITFAAKQLGVGTSFNFWIATVPTDDAADGLADRAPDIRTWRDAPIQPAVGARPRRR